MTVLCWIRNLKPWKYVMSRVQEIWAYTTPDSWRFCPGNQNPADIPSRGMSASVLVSKKRWWNGPEFLYKDEREWPQEDHIQSDNENAWKEIIQNPATTTHALISSTQVTKIGVHQIIDVNRYSSWKKLLRVTAYVLRFIRRSRKDKSLELCAEEVRSAEELWIKSIQYQSFPDEICHLVTARKLPEPPLMRQFNLYLDDSGLMRCRGRIQNSLLNQEAKTPILLPSKRHGVEWIIKDTQSSVTQWSKHNFDGDEGAILDNTRTTNC